MPTRPCDVGHSRVHGKRYTRFVFGLTWNRMIATGALLLVLLAPLCICYPVAASPTSGDCHGMPSEQGQSSGTPACCAVVPVPQPQLAASTQLERPAIITVAVVSADALFVPELLESNASIAPPHSPPRCSSILRI